MTTNTRGVGASVSVTKIERSLRVSAAVEPCPLGENIRDDVWRALAGFNFFPMEEFVAWE